MEVLMGNRLWRHVEKAFEGRPRECGKEGLGGESQGRGEGRAGARARERRRG